MRSIFYLLIITPILLMASAYAAEKNQPAWLDGGEFTWLFVMTGEVESASTTEIVINAHPTVVAFTDRPDRIVRATSLETFVDHVWQAGADSFETDPPNAALVFGDSEVAIDELRSVKRAGTTVSFSTDILEGALPRSGDEVVFVIDIF